MERLRKAAAQDRELKGNDRSRAFPEQSYSHAVQSNGKNLICKLSKSIYRLKQAAKNCSQLFEFSKVLREVNDYCLFLKKHKDDKLFVLTWVDDLIIAVNRKEINKLKNSLESKFKIKNQPTMSRSCCEAEHQGLAAAVQEAIVFHDLPRELAYEEIEPTTIVEDNQSSI